MSSMGRFSLSGKTALVTGAGRGLGKACVQSLAGAGARVIAVARTADDLSRLANDCPGVEPLTADVLDEDFYRQVEALDRLDILVNNAGTNRPQPFTEVDSEALSTVIELNVTAMFRTAQSAVRVMLRNHRGGSVIHMSSQMGHVGSPNRSVYCMTKHAVEGLTKAMAVELADRNIRVNAVAPTFIETSMTRPMLDDPGFRGFVERMIPMGKVGQPEDVADAVLYLASDASAMVTGTSLKVDGGWTAA
ncbi:MAG: SDR family oxidoreductase [Xanthomonadales bacterium]|nr:SDR family oxidoreductase [Xanthomonadales bacterium]